MNAAPYDTELTTQSSTEQAWKSIVNGQSSGDFLVALYGFYGVVSLLNGTEPHNSVGSETLQHYLLPPGDATGQ